MHQIARRTLLVCGCAPLFAPLAARAQRAAKIHRIGFVVPVGPGQRHDAFLRGLRELGYVEGQNYTIETRFAHGRAERLSGLIEEVVQQNVDVLVVGATAGARAARKATTSIPVVFIGPSDPVADGIVSNLARPEANITGVSLALGDTFAGKWLQLLKEAAPSVTHVAALTSGNSVTAASSVKVLESTAKTLNVRLDLHYATDLPQLDKALAAIGGSGARGLIVTSGPFWSTNQVKLVEFAANKRLPAMYSFDDFVDAGGLMSYGPSIVDVYRRAASYVDKILRGAKPGDLPVEQPIKFDLTINLQTARALGLKMPQSVLLRADRVVE